MATIAELNVRIGADTSALDRGIARAERTLKSVNAKFSALGDSLTQSITLPMGAIVAGALAAAGKMESLNLAMESTFQGAGRSVADARKEIEALRKAALAPGLDMPQAVKASLALQGIGQSAEKARNVIIQTANATATVGGNPANMEGVIRQFSQIISKGKVMTEDVNIIKENLPIVASLLENAFGTSNAEKLREMGINGQQFVDVLVAQMETLPRVAGGLSNTFTNVFSAIQQAAATLGMEFDKAFNVRGKLDNLATGVSNLVSWFVSLDDGTKKMALGFVVFAAAIGPAIKLTNMAVQAGGFLYTTFTSLRVAFTTIQTSGLISWFSGLNMVMKANVIVAVTSAAIALYAAFSSLRGPTDAAARAQETLAEAQKTVNAEAAKEIGTLNQSFEALKSSNTKQEDKVRILGELKKQYPGYLSHLDAESLTLGDLEKAQKNVNAAILQGIANRQKAAAVTSLYEKQAQIMLRIQNIKDGGAVTAGEAGLINTGDMMRAGSIAQAVIEKLQAQVSGLGDQAKKTGEAFDKAFDLKPPSDEFDRSKWEDQEYAAIQMAEMRAKGNRKIAESAKGKTKASKAAAAATKEEVDAFAELDAIMAQLEGQSAADAAQVVQPLPSGRGMGNTEYGVALPPVESMNAAAAAQERLNAAMQSAAALAKPIGDNYGVMGSAILAAGNAMTAAAENGETSMKKMALAAVAAAAKIVRAWIMQGVAGAVSKALTGIPFPFNIAAGAAAGGAAGVLFNGLLSKIQVPALAEGGLAYGPTMAMVGDNPGASGNPEVIAPLNKLKDIMSGGTNGTLSTSISGDNLLILLRRSETKSNRARTF